MDDILIATDKLDGWGGAVDYAARLAAHVRAQLTLTCVLPQATCDECIPSPLAAEIVDLLRIRAEIALRAGPAFTRWAAARGVPASAWHTSEGVVRDVLLAAAQWHDAVVLERNDVTPWSFAACLLLATDVPCIVLPDVVATPSFDTVAVAWDGSLQATRALHDALPLLRRAEHVVLIDATASGDVLDPYLREHGLNVTRMRVSAPACAGVEILAAAEDSADLLVMGVPGSSQFGEWTMGGAARHVLEHACIPLLLRH